MSGNVWEWVFDWYGNSGNGARTNPQGPANGAHRVYRGGSWQHYARYARVPARHGYSPDFRSFNLGFRLAMD